MKKIIFILLVIISIKIIPIPEYVELNNLAIIKEIKINCKKNTYEVTLKEIIPKKEENSINYEYKYYKEEKTSLETAYQNIEKKIHKKLYLDKAKIIKYKCKKNN